MIETKEEILQNFISYVHEPVRMYFSSDDKIAFFKNLLEEDERTLLDAVNIFEKNKYKQIKKLYTRFFEYLDPNNLSNVLTKHSDIDEMYYVGAIFEARYYIKRAIDQIINPKPTDIHSIEGKTQFLEELVMDYRETFLYFFKTGELDI